MTPRFQSSPDAAARLLLIDEERTRARALADGFCRFFAVELSTSVLSGRAAVEALKAQDYDIVLVDLISPGDLSASAEEAVARVVKLADGALTVVLSEASTVSAAVGVLRAGAHDFIARPLDAYMLADRIGELAHRHGKTRLLAGDAARDGSASSAAGTTRVPGTAGRAMRPAILPMWQQEQRIIEEAIATCAGNVALAAAALQLSPSTIYRKRQAWADAEDERGAA